MKLEDFQSDPLKFASLIAHQLQSPLNAVSAVLQTVISEYSGPLLPQQRDSLERASQRCDQAITTVRRMLAIIKAQQERDTDAEPAAVVAILRELHAQYVMDASAHDISLGLECDVGDAYVSIDKAALDEVLRALLNNALKYTPDHGRVDISAATGSREGFLRVVVSDSGVGVQPEDRDKIFEPFFRTPSARESARPGTGLGLAFVMSVVTASGGTVAVGKSPTGGAEFVLELPLAEMPRAASDASAKRAASFRVVIIGGVAAGPKAAAKIIRLLPEADVTVVDRGSVLSYAGCGLPYYVSGVVKDQKRLVSSPAGLLRDSVFFRNVKNVHVLNQTEALEIDRAAKRVRVRDALSKRESWLDYDKLLLATGAAAAVPADLDVSLKNVFTLHGVKDAEGIRASLAAGRARDVVIVGGGLIGIEMTEALVAKGARVTIVERLAHILPVIDPDISALVEKHMEANGVRIMTDTVAHSFEGEDDVSAVITSRGALNADMVILATGIRPNTCLAEQAGLELGVTGAIQVDGAMLTSDPDIYAAGDCAQTVNLLTGKPCYVPLGSTANKQARVAAVNICGQQDTFPGVLGSCICKVFDYSMGRTGLGEREAVESGLDVLTVLAPGPDREHFMPTVGLVLLKLIVDRKTRRVLGAQATGPGALDKRLDTAAMAIAAGMTVDQLANADLCYAPPYSAAMDNLITAANVARNKLDGHLDGIKPEAVRELMDSGETFVFLDVRTPQEHERVHLPRSELIPLGTLRGRLPTLPRDRLIVTFCDISLRGYEAALILKAAGMEQVKVMEGGIAMWPYETVE